MNMNITIKFENEAAARHFASWLCGQGEQSYWDWMECREEEEEGNITARQFIYHKDNKFVPDGEIGTVLGRRRK
jgi:hypothetical protein